MLSLHRKGQHPHEEHLNLQSYPHREFPEKPGLFPDFIPRSAPGRKTTVSYDHHIRRPVHQPSVIILTFNRREAVARTLRELALQSFTDITVVDNASTDGTADLLAPRKSQIGTDKRGQNAGQSSGKTKNLPPSSGFHKGPAASRRRKAVPAVQFSLT